jgi:GNAT superfamily N-acetyltransferase
VAGIRRAVVADLDRLVSMHRQFCELDQHPFSDERARRAFEPLVADDTHGVVWITWGWSIEAGGFEAVLDEIFVTDRGHGNGSALIDHLLTDAESRGIARVFLETELHNDTVRRLYERHGFAADDSIWMSREFTDLT